MTVYLVRRRRRRPPPTAGVRLGAASDGKIEIRAINVRDACHARDVFGYHSAAGTDRALARAAAGGHLLGQMLVGYPDVALGKGASATCPASGR